MKNTIKSLVLVAGITFFAASAHAQLASEQASQPAARKADNKVTAVTSVQTASSASATPVQREAIKVTEVTEAKAAPVAVPSQGQENTVSAQPAIKPTPEVPMQKQ